MMLQYLLPQGRQIHVCIYLRRTDVLMAEQFLDGPQVGAAFEQSRGERMAQRVWADGLRDAGFGGLTLDHDENHRAGQVGAAAVQEDISLLSRLDVHPAAVVEPQHQLADGAFGDWHEALLAALAHDADIALLQIQIVELQRHQLRHAQPAGKQNLDDGAVAVTLPSRQVNGLFHPVNLTDAQHLGQLCS